MYGRKKYVGLGAFFFTFYFGGSGSGGSGNCDMYGSRGNGSSSCNSKRRYFGSVRMVTPPLGLG